MALVEQVLNSHRQLTAATTALIGRFVYELYALTADEIKIVEGATP